MDKVYRNTAFLILIIIIGVQWGFYATYTSQFPNFKNATPTIHVHGALLMIWLVLLVVQPLLIHSGRAQLHRSIGKIAWVLGPAIIVTMFLIGKTSYQRNSGLFPAQEMRAFIALDLRGFLSFAAFWALAMFHRKTPDVHMRYMIATGILAIGPGVGRGLASSLGLDLFVAITITDAINLAIVALLLGADIYRKKNTKPFLAVFGVLLVGTLLWQAKDSAAWQTFAGWYASVFY